MQILQGGGITNYGNHDFKIMKEQNLCGVYATFHDNLVYAVFGGALY